MAKTDEGSAPEAIPPRITASVLTVPSNPPYTIDFKYYPYEICFSWWTYSTVPWR